MFANLNTQETRAALPPSIAYADRVVTNPAIAAAVAAGWRIVRNTDSPQPGYAFTSYLAQDVDGLYCDLVGQSPYDVAAASAAAAAAQVSTDKSDAKTLAELATTPTGRVIQAVCAIVLQEINTLRTKAGLATYTSSQFLSALKAKVDAQS